MRILKKLFDFYVESSIHVALAVYALIQITIISLNISNNEPVAWFGFFGTIVGYNFIKYDELARIKKIKLTTSFKAIIGLSILSVFATFYYFFELKTKTKLIGFGAFLLTILYTLPFFPNKSNLRNWSGLKIYLVVVTWVGVTVLLPVINAEFEFSLMVVLKCIERFIFIFVLMLIFEIIDLQFDEKSLQTIPQRFGEKQTKGLNYVLIGVFFVMEFLKPNLTTRDLLITCVVTFILVVFTFFANSKRNKYYTSFWVEGIPIFWFVLISYF